MGGGGEMIRILLKLKFVYQGQVLLFSVIKKIKMVKWKKIIVNYALDKFLVFILLQYIKNFYKFIIEQ